MGKIRAFISSTCFDLSQVRRDIRGYLENTGFEVFTSESGDFPIDPFKSNLENCLSNINESDIFIIIVGCRYGSTDSSGTSITNKEFNHAKSLGIPVYAFLDSAIVTMIPIWKANKEAKFPNVDNSNVIKFADDIRSDQWSWVHQYTSAESITAILRDQIPVLFKNSLDSLKRNRSAGIESLPDWLPASCVSLIRDKPKAWEYLLFSEILKLEISQSSERRLDVEFSINNGMDGMLEYEIFPKWSLYQIDKLQKAANSTTAMFTYLKMQGFKELGVPGDWKGIVAGTKQLGKFYRFIIEWVINVKSTHIDDKESSREVLAVLADFGMELIEQVERYSTFVSDTLAGISEKLSRGEKTSISLVLEIALSDNIVERHEKALRKWANDHGIPY